MKSAEEKVLPNLPHMKQKRQNGEGAGKSLVMPVCIYSPFCDVSSPVTGAEPL